MRTRRTRRQPNLAVTPLECLESRELLSVTLNSGLLNIVGTDGSDKVIVTVDDDTDSLRVRLETPNGVELVELPAEEVVRAIDIRTLGGNDRVVIAGDVDDWLDPSEGFVLQIDTGSGNDLVRIAGGFKEDAWVDGGDGRDRIRSGSGDDEIHGGAGNDWIHAGRGDDDVFGEEGRDRLKGGPGDDALDGGLGFDLLWGLRGSDTLFGQEGNDRLFGNGGHDLLLGGLGRDILRGGAGKDMTDADPYDGRVVGVEYEQEIRYELAAILLSDTSNTWAKVRYRFKLEQDGEELELKAHLKVIVIGGDPLSTYDVTVDGQYVGTVTTNLFGIGWANFWFKMEQSFDSESSATWTDDDDYEDQDEHEMEDSFEAYGNLDPSLLPNFRPGAAITVGDLSGTFYFVRGDIESEVEVDD